MLSGVELSSHAKALLSAAKADAPSAAVRAKIWSGVVTGAKLAGGSAGTASLAGAAHTVGRLQAARHGRAVRVRRHGRRGRDDRVRELQARASRGTCGARRAPRPRGGRRARRGGCERGDGRGNGCGGWIPGRDGRGDVARASTRAGARNAWPPDGGGRSGQGRGPAPSHRRRFHRTAHRSFGREARAGRRRRVAGVARGRKRWPCDGRASCRARDDQRHRAQRCRRRRLPRVLGGTAPQARESRRARACPSRTPRATTS